RNYRWIMDRVGQFPGGGFAGDENVRLKEGDPRQGFETCGFVEFMRSVGYRLREMNFSVSGAARIRQGRDPSAVSGNGIFVPADDAPRA
ncbi:MAG: hypothetical protein ACKORC_03040, partial [Acidimicrobiia bacterium]